MLFKVIGKTLNKRFPNVKLIILLQQELRKYLENIVKYLGHDTLDL